ncbi:hypothetical protein RHGRI_015853 [Rhododendron griersonianum]|uniref:CCHC-type domain-containing protein n=1 Tax=Rhododendron griersonianum TaxID=479676 RepID=A0AAV6JTC5_9ERIC|nr:hypothetical protein RHGRI_015853 [Rhododendron griersonianum]
MLQSESHKSKIKSSTKSIAFKSTQIDETDSDCNEDGGYDTEAIDLFLHNFEKFFKKKAIKNDSKSKKNNCDGKEEFSSGKGKNGGKGPPSRLKCSECHGYGHLADECVNILKRKINFKANITWDDIDSDKFEEEHKDETNLIAFGASLHSRSSDHESSDDSEDGETDEDEGIHEFKEKYNHLYEESVKIAETNLKLVEKYKKSNLELAAVSIQVEELQGSLSTLTFERDQLIKEVEILKEKNKVLFDENIQSVSKINDLQVEYTSANDLFERLNTGSRTLDNILSIQRPTSDKTGLGFYEASSSKTVGGKLNELEPKKVTPKPHSIDTAKNVIGKTHDIKKGSFTNFIPTCHYCKIKGHIKPKCFQLHGYPQGFRHYKNTTKVGSIGNVMTNLVKNKKIKSLWLKPLSENQKNFGKIQTRQIWVKKCDLDCFVAHTTFKARNSHMWNRNSDCSRYMPSNKIGWGMSH